MVFSEQENGPLSSITDSEIVCKDACVIIDVLAPIDENLMFG